MSGLRAPAQQPSITHSGLGDVTSSGLERRTVVWAAGGHVSLERTPPALSVGPERNQRMLNEETDRAAAKVAPNDFENY